MSSKSKGKGGAKNIRALFSVICISIIALGLIVYFSANSVADNGTVNEDTTIADTQEETENVQKSVTQEDVSEDETENETEAETQAESTSETTTESTSMALTDTNTPYKSYYKYPIGEAVLNAYTEELVYNSTMGDYRSHTAVDFKAEAGAEVVAINDGIVTDVYTDNLYGVVVEIDHGGYLVARYCGLDSLSVSAGDSVTIGQTIGTLGTVAFEQLDETHLHFETLLSGEYVNPLDVMGKTE
ncbi:MAG: M23 family metallopeptidase [Clostridiales bacterium]|nr:M23 family metallopeptidase [Clostridiales bacterium]